VVKKSGGGSDAEHDLGVSFSVAFSPAGDVLATCAKRRVIVWTVEPWAKRWESSVLKDPSDLAFSPDGSSIAAKNTSGRLVLFDAAVGASLRVLDKGTGEGSAPVFSADGARLAHGSWEGDVWVVDVASGKTVGHRSFAGEMIRAIHRLGSGWLVVRSPTTATGISGGERATFLPLDLEGEHAESLAIGDADHTTVAPDGRVLAVSRSQKRELALVEIPSGRVLATTRAKFGGTGAAVCFGDGLLGSVQEGRVEILRASTLERLGGLEVPYPSDVAFSPDGSLVAFGSWSDGSVRKVSEVLTL
jgi:Tol biopolymer transport system component